MGQSNRLLRNKRTQIQRSMYYMIHLCEVKKQARLLDSVRSQGSGYLSERRRDWYGLGHGTKKVLEMFYN